MVYFPPLIHAMLDIQAPGIHQWFKPIGRGYSLFPGLLFILIIINTSRVIAQSSSNPKAEGDPAILKALKEFDTSTSCHYGISIYDAQKGQYLFRQGDENYFIPASNTKILTLYATLQTLKPQLDAAYILEKGDTLFVWGLADPGTLYPNIDSANALLNLIHLTDKTVVFSNQLFQTSRFGKGWAWDDHPRSFQCERNAFPIYGNRLWIDRVGDSIHVTPNYFSTILTITKDSVSKVDRSEWGDQYMYHYLSSKKEEHKTIPITFFKNDLSFIWSEVTGKRISFSNIPLSDKATPFPGSVRDTMLKYMIQDSDNFVAEELMLASSFRTVGVMDEALFIERMTRGPMRFMLDTIQWYDGSGLSRYNLVTPNCLVRVLNKIYDEKGINFVKEIFSAGGMNGSLLPWKLEKEGQSFVFAKSGTMRNVLNLSGYLVTKKGKVLIFSWMNNQCMNKPADTKESMEKFLTFLYEEY